MNTFSTKQPCSIPLLFLILSIGFSTTPWAAEMSHDMPHNMDMSHPMFSGMMPNTSHEMQGLLGPYAMTREASGTSWQPEATPMEGIHCMSDADPTESCMMHGFATLIYDHQGGPRGGNKLFSTSMLMGMGRKEVGANVFGARAMFSLDPVMGKRGYPLLFQVGETADGTHELVDRQHPHDAVMELSTSYTRILSDISSAFVYLALPGEPALGPPVFMHRYSGMDIPEAPLTHHKLDATHVSFGVFTLGYVYNGVKLEGSLFNGREPDQSRWNIENPRFNSQAVRLSYNPIPALAFQVSTAHLRKPDLLSPQVDVNRTTASAMYDQILCGNDHWQTTFAWGQNNYKPGHALGGYLLESALHFKSDHTVFGRFEWLEENALFEEDNPLHDKIFKINKLSIGYLYDITRIGQAQFGVGGLISFFKFPNTLKAAYGDRPRAFMLFARLKL